MQENEQDVDNTPKEKEEVENSNLHVEVTKEVVESLDTRDSEQLPEKFVHQIKRIENSNLSTIPSEQNSFALVKQTSEHLQYIRNIAEELVKSSLCPFKKPEDAMLAIITGQQYNFPFITSVNNIYVVNNRTAMSTHLHRALIIQHKIMFKKIYNYEPIYAFIIKKDKLDGTKQNILVGQGILAEKQEGWISSTEPIDRITKYRFTRIIKQIDGTFEKLETESEFKLSDAIQAGLSTKDNWKNFPQRMLDARAFSIGAKEIGSDILLGIYTISELADLNNTKYIISSGLEEEIVRN